MTEEESEGGWDDSAEEERRRGVEEMCRERMREDSKPRMGKTIIQRKKQKDRRRRETRPGPWSLALSPKPNRHPRTRKVQAQEAAHMDRVCVAKCSGEGVEGAAE
jgi:hypothetical protein